MRSLMILIVLVSTMALTACGQKENVPEKVKTAFDQKFPNAKKIRWDKENASEWEAEFKINGVEYSANFKSDGTWMETEYEIEESELPAAVKQTLDNEFASYEIEEVEISETREGKVFELQMEKDDTDVDVAISPVGKVLKKEAKEEGDEDND